MIKYGILAVGYEWMWSGFFLYVKHLMDVVPLELQNPKVY